MDDETSGDGRSEEERVVRALFERLVPMAEQPEGELPDAELVAALGEGRLLPSEEARLVEAIRQSPRARVELRTVYPETWQRVLGEPARRRAPRLQLIRGGLAAAAVGLAAAAALFFLIPPRAPVDTDFEVAAVQTQRGAADDLRPGEQVQLLLDLGHPGWLDAARGGGRWGALYRIDADGKVALLCTSETGGCRVSDETMAWLHTAPSRPGATTRFFFVAGARPYAGAPALAEGDREGFESRLRAAAESESWRVHEQALTVAR